MTHLLFGMCLMCEITFAIPVNIIIFLLNDMFSLFISEGLLLH